MATAAQRFSSLQKKAIVVSLSIGRLRTTRRVSSNSVQSDADPEMLHVSKTILESKELKAVGAIDMDIVMYLRGLCLPSPFKSGMYLLPIDLLDRVSKRLDEMATERKQSVDAFMAMYEKAKALVDAEYPDGKEPIVAADSPESAILNAKKSLGSLFDPADYPPVDEVRKRFVLDYQFLELNTPGSLKTVNKDLYEKELKKMENVWADASEKVVAVLLEEFREMTRHMAERLAPNEDGTPKVFRSTLITKMQGWLDVFDARNLTNDAELKSLVTKARQMIAGVDPDTIRSGDVLRKELSEEFRSMTEQLDQAIVDLPSRRLRIDEE